MHETIFNLRYCYPDIVAFDLRIHKKKQIPIIVMATIVESQLS